MLDPAFVRNNIDKIKALIDSGRASKDKVNIDLWVELDLKRKDLILKLEEINKERNNLAGKGNSNQSDSESLREMGKRLKEESNLVESELKEVNAKWQNILDWMPNMPLVEVPTGNGEEDNIEFKAWSPLDGYLAIEKLSGVDGSKNHLKQIAYNSNPDSEFKPLPHWEIGTKLDLIDLEQGAKVSGSRFYYIKNEGVLIIMGIFNMLTKKLLQEGFNPMIVPVLVKEKTLYGSGHFPGDEDQVYKLENNHVEDSNSLYLLGSSEPSNFAYFMDKTLDLKDLPVKIFAQTPCFRSEVGSWGKDVRGIKRTHQFEKLEMNLIIEADDSKAREMHEYLLSLNEWLMQELKLPYHVINMCINDLGYFAAAKKYDIEAWIPSEGEFMEVASNSITTDFQSRRLNIKYKDAEGKSKFVYTLNDTGATHRLLIAIIEHYQTAEGDLIVPEKLRDFVGKNLISRKG